MTIPFRIKLLTDTAKAPTQENKGDLWDIYADSFESPTFKNNEWIMENRATIYPNSRILVKTGIALELPIHLESEIRKQYIDEYGKKGIGEINVYDMGWQFQKTEKDNIKAYAVADLRPRSDNLEQKGLFIESKIIKSDEISFIAINHGHEPIIINKGDAIAKMIVYPFYASKMEIVKDVEDTGRGGYGSTGK